MMNNPHRSQRNTIEQLVEALKGLPQVHTDAPVWEPTHPDRGIDAKVDVVAGEHRYMLLIETKKDVFPRDVRQVLWHMKEYANTFRVRDRATSIVLLLAAESISQGAKELLKQESVGYFDTGGSLFIPAPGAYVYIEKPPPKTLAKSTRALFKGKSSQVFYALFHRRDAWFSVKELAQLAKVSPATASETLTALERLDWVTSRGQGPSKERRLSAPTLLLDEWKKQMLAARQPPMRRYYVPATDVSELPNRLAHACESAGLEYVITQEAAAQVYAPFLSKISRVACRIAPGDPDAALTKLQARVVTEGANLLVIETKSEGEFLFKERHDSVWLANPVRVYLDLLRSGGRAEEAAEHLRRERIGV
jgi:DNA-binding transcriptional ArsR family regulator